MLTYIEITVPRTGGSAAYKALSRDGEHPLIWVDGEGDRWAHVSGDQYRAVGGQPNTISLSVIKAEIPGGYALP